MQFPKEWPQFFTATIHQWKPCLTDNKCKDIIIECLQTMVHKKQIELNAFAILNNHVHVIWQPLGIYSPAQIHSSFTNFTGKQIKNILAQHQPTLLEEMRSKNLNRVYQIWKRRSLSIELSSEAVFEQKLDY
ncbi:MAG: transposase, partial [Chitinophagaceae bacterium]